jgi:DNA-binding GntR family transcriptional regulator
MEDPTPDVSEPISATILREVRDLILAGELAPGEHIRQEALAERFGVSRIPVREALRRLEDEDLVTLVPHSGARVTTLDFAECMELYRLRESLEPLLMEEVARRATDEDITSFEAALARVEAAAAAGDPARWVVEDRLLHLGMYRVAQLPRVLAVAETAWNQTQQCRRAYMGPAETAPFDVAHREHRLIVDAIRRRDEVDAADMQRRHIRRTRNVLAERARGLDPIGAPESDNRA